MPKRWTTAALVWLRTNITWLTLVTIGLYPASPAWRRFAPRLIDGWQSYRKPVRQSEGRYFRDFEKACRSGDEDGMVKSFWRWLDRPTPEDRTASLEWLARSADDKEIMAFARDTAKGRYRAPYARPGNGGTIYRPVAQFRRRLIGRDTRVTVDGGTTLNARSPVRTG